MSQENKGKTNKQTKTKKTYRVLFFNVATEKLIQGSMIVKMSQNCGKHTVTIQCRPKKARSSLQFNADGGGMSRA